MFTCKFYSPGTFVKEVSTIKVPDINPLREKQKCSDITERHDSHPYGFQYFYENGRAKTGIYYLNARVVDQETVKKEYGENSILYRNMIYNNISHVAITTTPWKHHGQYDPSNDHVI